MRLARKHRQHKSRHPGQGHGRDLSSADLQAAIADGIAKLAIEPTEQLVSGCSQFVELLAKWNSVYNLTSVRDKRQMVERHILDSLVVAPWIQGEHIIDTGCGAGLPGIPLALAMSQRQFLLVDSNNKKTRFVHQAIDELQLTNVRVIQERVEQLQTDTLFDCAIARAFTSIENFVHGVDHVLAPKGRILAMKGTYPLAELEAIPDGFQVDSIEKLDVPGLAADRHLVILSRQ